MLILEQLKWHTVSLCIIALHKSNICEIMCTFDWRRSSLALLPRHCVVLPMKMPSHNVEMPSTLSKSAHICFSNWTFTHRILHTSIDNKAFLPDSTRRNAMHTTCCIIWAKGKRRKGTEFDSRTLLAIVNKLLHIHECIHRTDVSFSTAESTSWKIQNLT